MIGDGLVAQSDPRPPPNFAVLRWVWFLLKKSPALMRPETLISTIAVVAAFGCGAVKAPRRRPGTGARRHPPHVGGASSPFQTAATYDVLQTAPPRGNDGGLIAFQPAEFSFDQSGSRAMTAW